ncbi:MAG: hypothetical protein AAGA56_06040 [Myxococcota bacterium]
MSAHRSALLLALVAGAGCEPSTSAPAPSAKRAPPETAPTSVTTAHMRAEVEDCSSARDEDRDGRIGCRGRIGLSIELPDEMQRVTAIVPRADGRVTLAGVLKGYEARPPSFVVTLDATGKRSSLRRLSGAVFHAAGDDRGGIYLVGQYHDGVEHLRVGETKTCPRPYTINPSGFALRLTDDGEPAWCFVIGAGATAASVRAIAIDARGHAWVAGRIGFPRTSAYFAELDREGGAVFVWRGEGAGEVSSSRGHDVAITEDGDAVFTGWVEGIFPFGTPKDAQRARITAASGGILFRVGPGGTLRWTRSLGEHTMATHVAVTPETQVVLSGSFRHVLDFGGRRLLPAEGRGVILTHGDDGTPQRAVQLSEAAFIDLVDDDTHSFVGRKTRGYAGLWEQGTLVAMHPRGHRVVASTYQGRFKGFGRSFTSASPRAGVVALVDESGAPFWVTNLGDNQLIHAVAVDPMGRVWVGGSDVISNRATVTRLDP